MVHLESLNANQLESVKWNNGPLLVLAGPGSGKTRVLTYRIARIIEETPGQYFKILGLTFTNKAAAEMRKRLESLVPNVSERTLLTTFHSFCLNILRQHGHHIGFKPDITVLPQEADREVVLEEAISMTREQHCEINYRGSQLLPLVSRLLDYSVSADDAVEFLKKRDIRGAELIGFVYKNFRNSMKENNELDFSGIIAETIELLIEKPSVRKQISRIYPYICVDEFQDTNRAQYQVLRLITNPTSKNLFVVADDDQVIYQWNGANPQRLKSLQSDFDVSVLQLPESYRCPSEVIEIANKLIEHNPTHYSEKLPLTAHKQGDTENVIRVKDFSSFEMEADWVASDIAKRSLETRIKCVILARNRRLLEQVLVRLTLHEVQANLSIRKDEFVSNPMVWLHSILRLANSRQDREQLRRVCDSFYELDGTMLNTEDIISDSTTDDGDYLRAWYRLALKRNEIDNKAKRFMNKTIPILIDRLDFWTFMKDSFEWFSFLPEIGLESEESYAEFDEEKETWNSLVNEIVSEFGKDPVTLNVLLQGLDLRSKTPNPPKGSVPLLTIHASKGMEFDHVYLVGLMEDQIPSWHATKKGDDSREMQEERRNCFVAITRVQQSLTLTYSHEVFGWRKEPSRFLREMELLD